MIMNKAFILAGLLEAETPRDRELQLTFLRAMTAAIRAGEELDDDAFALLVEDSITGPAISTRRAARLVQETGAFVLKDGVWSYAAPLIDNGKALNLSDFAKLFEDDADPVKSNRDVLMSEVEKAISLALSWTVDMTLAARRSGEIAGQPAFYTCEEDGDRIIGFKAAGTATSDSLTALCQSTEDLLHCGKASEDVSACIAFLLEKTLATQCVDSGWDYGGFYPLEDQPDAEHPTVDATCLAVMALCEFLDKQSKLKEFSKEQALVDQRATMAAIVSGIEFLLRIQNEDGSFSIYRFENGALGTPNENCTRAAQSTLGMGKGSGAFDVLGREDLYAACSRAIAKSYHYLSSHTASDGFRQLWAPYFGIQMDVYSSADVINSSAKVGRSFIPVWWQMEEERSRILAYWRSLADYWSDHVQEAEQVGFYRFSTPTAEAFSSGEYAWASHPDMLAAFTLLQAHNQFAFQLSDRNWELIENAVRRTLSLQHPHGHLDNPLARRTPFCAATFAAVELLQEYRVAKKT